MDELHSNWSDAYKEVQAAHLNKSANLIGFLVVFKIKDNHDRSLRLKGRLVVHGNHYKDRFFVRRDSASVNLFIFRFLLSLTQILDFNLATADVKEAYMQSGPIARELYVHPPHCFSARGVL